MLSRKKIIHKHNQPVLKEPRVYIDFFRDFKLYVTFKTKSELNVGCWFFNAYYDMMIKKSKLE